MKFLKVLAALLVLCIVGIIGLYVSYPWIYPTYTTRYRLTVNAAIGEQQYSGSSVIEIRVKMQPRLLGDMPSWTFRVNGDAVFVDLGSGRNLVAPLSPGPSKGSDAVNVLFRAFHIPFLADNAADLKSLHGERGLDPAAWPAFVTFRDVNNPLSVEVVNPPALEKTFGPGARIDSVTLTITNDPVTRGLEQGLPWLASALSDKDKFALAKRHFSRTLFIRNEP
jgi:hypothetical protein